MIGFIQWFWSYYAFLRRAADQAKRKELNKTVYAANKDAMLELRETLRKAYERSQCD